MLKRIFCLLISLWALFLSSCALINGSDNSSKGSIQLYCPNINNRAAESENESCLYSITVVSSSGEIVASVTSESGKNVVINEIFPGSYTVDVVATVDGKAYASGSASVEVVAGEDALVEVKLKVIANSTPAVESVETELGIKFKISNIYGWRRIKIFRKAPEDSELRFYGNIANNYKDFTVNSFEWEDPFVEEGKEYQYAFSLVDANWTRNDYIGDSYTVTAKNGLGILRITNLPSFLDNIDNNELCYITPPELSVNVDSLPEGYTVSEPVVLFYVDDYSRELHFWDRGNGRYNYSFSDDNAELKDLYTDAVVFHAGSGVYGNVQGCDWNNYWLETDAVKKTFTVSANVAGSYGIDLTMTGTKACRSIEISRKIGDGDFVEYAFISNENSCFDVDELTWNDPFAPSGSTCTYKVTLIALDSSHITSYFSDAVTVAVGKGKLSVSETPLVNMNIDPYSLSVDNIDDLTVNLFDLDDEYTIYKYIIVSCDGSGRNVQINQNGESFEITASNKADLDTFKALKPNWRDWNFKLLITINANTPIEGARWNDFRLYVNCDKTE